MFDLDREHMVQSPSGGWQRLEDYCNSEPRGNDLHYTSSLITMDEELLALELGTRVADEFLSWAVEGWDALSDAAYMEHYTACGGYDDPC